MQIIITNWGLDSGCWGLLEFLELFIAYSDDENPVFELVEVIVLVDKSITGAFEFEAFKLMLVAPVAAVAVVVDVGDGELDEALYGNGAAGV